MDTTRLHLRPFAGDDAVAIHRVYSDPEVMRHVAGGPVADLAATEGMLRDYIAHQQTHGFSFWAVIERGRGMLIGDAGLYLFEGRGPEVELGYTLGRPWCGRGYARVGPRAREDRHGLRGAPQRVRTRTSALPQRS